MRPQESVGTVAGVVNDSDHVGGVREEMDSTGVGEKLLPPQETGGLHGEQN